jgi:hypothetical protein
MTLIPSIWYYYLAGGSLDMIAVSLSIYVQYPKELNPPIEPGIIILGFIACVLTLYISDKLR